MGIVPFGSEELLATDIDQFHADIVDVGVPAEGRDLKRGFLWSAACAACLSAGGDSEDRKSCEGRC